MAQELTVSSIYVCNLRNIAGPEIKINICSSIPTYFMTNECAIGVLTVMYDPIFLSVYLLSRLLFLRSWEETRLWY